jgi:hypothetical protein
MLTTHDQWINECSPEVMAGIWSLLNLVSRGPHSPSGPARSGGTVGFFSPGFAQVRHKLRVTDHCLVGAS